MAQGKIYIYGRHALEEALRFAPRTVKKVYLANQMDDANLRALISRAGIPVAALSGSKGECGVEGNVSHQGIIGLLSVGELVRPFKEFISGLEVKSDTCLALLGEVQDPHNVGAIIRSAAAFGVSAVLIPEHKQAPITGAVVKVSAGMAFRLPIVSIGNVNSTIRELKDKGFWVYGLAGEGASSISAEAFDSPTLFVLGNESQGIRSKTREYCDKLLSIPINSRCESLNVAASTAVALYAWSSKHPKALAA